MTGDVFSLKTAFGALVLAGLVGCGSTPDTGSLEDFRSLERVKLINQLYQSRAARIIQGMCANNDLFMIVDSFSLMTPYYGEQLSYHTKDVDGDGTDDMSHGDLKAVLALLAGMNIVTFGLSGHDEKPAEGTKLPKGEFVRALKAILKGIKNGSIPAPRAISASLSKKMTIDELHLLLGYDLALTPENIVSKRDEIISRIKVKVELNGAIGSKAHLKTLEGLQERYELIQDFEELGIVLITAAGNDGNDRKVNMLAVLGTLTFAIGSLTQSGEISPYTSDSSLVVGYSPGDFVSRRDKWGNIDINNDGIPDFLAKNLSSGEPLAQRINERPFYFDPETMGVDGGRLITMEQYYLDRGASKENIPALIEAYGDYVWIPKGMRPVDGLKLWKMPDGRLIFDPAKSFADDPDLDDDDPDQVSFRMGTSYAVPSICEEFMPKQQINPLNVFSAENQHVETQNGETTISWSQNIAPRRKRPHLVLVTTQKKTGEAVLSAYRFQDDGAGRVVLRRVFELDPSPEPGREHGQSRSEPELAEVA